MCAFPSAWNTHPPCPGSSGPSKNVPFLEKSPQSSSRKLVLCSISFHFLLGSSSSSSTPARLSPGLAGGSGWGRATSMPHNRNAMLRPNYAQAWDCGAVLFTESLCHVNIRRDRCALPKGTQRGAPIAWGTIEGSLGLKGMRDSRGPVLHPGHHSAAYAKGQLRVP